MKKSIQTKIIRLIVTGMLIIAILIGGTSLYSFGQVAEEDSLQIMNLTCEERAGELNDILSRIEQSVNIMSLYAVEKLESMERLTNDRAYHEAYVSLLSELAQNIVDETDGSVAIYVRLNAELGFPSSGFFKVKNAQTGEFEDLVPTDLSLYEKDDREHVCWYYEPIEAGQAVWLDPYYNKNIDVEMVSYVVPVYKEDQLLAVVGMDIDFGYIKEIVDEIEIYNTGHALIADENFIIAHSKVFEAGTMIPGVSDDLSAEGLEKFTQQKELYECTIDGVKQSIAFSRLNNGKIMAVIVPTAEIYHASNVHAIQSITIAIIITLIFILLTLRSAKGMIHPLQELNTAAQEIAKGNLDVSLDIRTQDEIGTLAESLSETARQLKIKIDYINNLAYSDKLTGVKNNTAYLHDVAVLKGDMQGGNADFAIFVIDVNGLKYINDTYGHELGNELIINAAQIATDVFGHENLYRIGGDEFAVLYRDVSEEMSENYKRAFLSALETQKGRLYVSASIGGAIYNKNTDNTYEVVFNRADEEMYNNKVRMKAMGKVSKLIENEG